ncbi:glycosyltransferase [Pseudoalteromonas sp. MelDa3]|uniref:glycosyltransferase n=1 Tax=Pseudoalteromonas sp. MelDa3 TaxID=888435 RepID=UPI000CB0451E|nr:glycosyltransferase [Pseudoalteromonas sp. MelDa3]PLT24711.1 glycosyltransferase [Pseudoalteromonas sp. MelDa3]
MRKILFVSPTAKLGGAERVMQTIAHYLLQQGWEVTFYIMSRGSQSGWEELQKFDNFNFIVKEYKSEKTSLLSFLYNIISLNRKSKFHYIFSSHSHTNAALSFLKKIDILPDAKLVGRESTIVFERFYGAKRRIFKILYNYFYGSHDLLICQTELMKKSLICSLEKLPAKNIQVIPNPLSIDRIDSGLKESVVKLRDLTVKNIVACGRLVPVKNFSLLINVLSRLILEGYLTHLYIVGDGVDRKLLCDLSTSLKLDNYITFVGHQENTAQWYKIADVGVISSIKEGFPNVILEMMASGTKNIVTTPCTGDLDTLPEVIISEDHSEEALYLAVKSVLRKSNDHGEIYRKYIETHRTVEMFWKTLETKIKNKVTD